MRARARAGADAGDKDSDPEQCEECGELFKPDELDERGLCAECAAYEDADDDDEEEDDEEEE